MAPEIQAASQCQTNAWIGNFRSSCGAIVGRDSAPTSDLWTRVALASFHGRGIQLGDVFPIHEVIDNGLEIVGPTIAIVDVVGVLPYVHAKYRVTAMHERVLAVSGLGHNDIAIHDREPSPARTELRHASLNEIHLGLFDRAERVGKRLFERAGNVAAALWLQPLPETRVIVVLGGIVEETRILSVRF